jgi:nitroreductase
MELVKWLNWRYATKSYTDKKIPAEQLAYILEAARMAPSSSGLQAYKIFVVSDQKLKEEIKPIAMGQQQVVDCSQLLVFASWDKYDSDRVSETFSNMEIARGMPAGKMTDYKNMLLSMYTPLGADWQANHAARQAYISASMAMVAAAECMIDATPMEGFKNADLDKLLQLEEKGLKSQLIVTLGYRNDENDWNLKFPKYRRSMEELVVKL